MKKRCTFCWAVSGLLIIVIAFGAFKFIVTGNVEKGDDGRLAILLSDGERQHVLGEMRGLLEAVQGITEGIVANDMEAVATSASAVGMVLARGENPATVAKLPLEFKKSGFAAHSAFDDLAANARDFGDQDMALEQLSVILGACTACHAGYRFELEDD